MRPTKQEIGAEVARLIEIHSNNDIEFDAPDGWLFLAVNIEEGEKEKHSRHPNNYWLNPRTDWTMRLSILRPFADVSVYHRDALDALKKRFKLVFAGGEE